jgi:cephalosporin hydroxylase
MTLTLLQEYVVRCAGPSDIHEHLPTLFEAVLTCPSRNPYIVECGVRSGNSTAALLYGLVVRQGGTLLSVDPAVPDVPDHWFANPYWTYVRGDDCDPLVTADIEPGIDILFIDTSHTYEHTLRELQVYWPRVRPGGVAFFHDTETEGCGVSDALDAFFGQDGWTNQKNCYGLGRAVAR